ncbi:hypothetical protein MMB232_00531 [Brevundimonas subvibrioides]|uniref:DUF3597 domain-containing protein n=1 Tax=Brevundimonas subvibrioides TaxID=74313 RepID=UPI003A6A04DB
MSILGNILGKIFKRKDEPKAPSAPSQPAPTSTPVQPQVTAAAATAPQPAPAVDVAGILDFMNEQRDQKLNWRTSIVDLMKLCGMESSLAERKELADELGYTGDKSELGLDEHLAAQAGAAEDRGQRRSAARRYDALSAQGLYGASYTR